MTERDLRGVSPIILAFQERFKEFSKEHPQESQSLLGELMLWASIVDLPGGAMSEVIASQIEYNVGQIGKRGKEISVEDYLKRLFSPNPAGEITADIIMHRLQSNLSMEG